jgi:hypothetical protein
MTVLASEPSECSTRAMPKSASLTTRPGPCRKMLPALRSRCSTRRLWQKRMALESWQNHEVTSSSEKKVLASRAALMACCRSPPSQNSSKMCRCGGSPSTQLP